MHLEIKDLHVFYGKIEAIKGISFSVNQGEIVTLIGANGAGKTTTLHTISGLIKSTSGSILFKNTAIQKIPAHKITTLGISQSPEGRLVFPNMTVKENLETGFAPLKRADAYVPEEIYDLFPVLKDMLGRRGGDLSGGQQQQLAIARALVTRPQLLVLDEPTEGIQPSIIKDIGRAIDYLRGKGDMAIVLVEQFFEFARDLADDFAVLDRGSVVMAGDKASMVEKDVRAYMSV